MDWQELFVLFNLFTSFGEMTRLDIIFILTMVNEELDFNGVNIFTFILTARDSAMIINFLYIFFIFSLQFIHLVLWQNIFVSGV